MLFAYPNNNYRSESPLDSYFSSQFPQPFSLRTYPIVLPDIIDFNILDDFIHVTEGMEKEYTSLFDMLREVGQEYDNLYDNDAMSEYSIFTRVHQFSTIAYFVMEKLYSELVAMQQHIEAMPENKY